jgi:hypothetical protein
MKRKPDRIPWYASCVLFSQLPEPMRRHVERRQRALWWKIAKLPREMGEDLDTRAAPLHVFRAIAWARSADEKRIRHAFAIEYHATTGQWPYGVIPAARVLRRHAA